MSRVARFALIAGLAFLPLGGALAAAPTLEETLAASASTPAQHQALAAYYRGKADAAKKEAEEHRAMGRAYSGRKDMAQLMDHCNKLATLQEDVAKQYMALAEAEEKAAK